jgi:predicted phage baseplate assembly protein
MELLVREDALPPSRERDLIESEEGPDAIEVVKDELGAVSEVWIRYHEVEHFHASTSISRHFVVDYKNGRILFGDGSHGIIPPRIKGNIKIRSYRVGGGAAGNVASGTIATMRDNVPFIAGAFNPFPAEGGADLEDLGSLKYRAAGVFKSLNRAVTREDYEWLALESSASVARAHCLSRCGSRGEVVLVLVPVGASRAMDLLEHPMPSPELLRRVREYLDERRLIGTSLRVDPPVYRQVSVRLRLALNKSCVEIQQVKDAAEARVRKALHPLYGGDGKGWPFGQSLTGAAVFDALDGIEGMHHVEEIRLVDGGIGKEVEKIALKDDELLAVTEVAIDARKFEW